MPTSKVAQWWKWKWSRFSWGDSQRILGWNSGIKRQYSESAFPQVTLASVATYPLNAGGLRGRYLRVFLDQKPIRRVCCKKQIVKHVVPDFSPASLFFTWKEVIPLEGCVFFLQQLTVPYRLKHCKTPANPWIFWTARCCTSTSAWHESFGFDQSDCSCGIATWSKPA